MKNYDIFKQLNDCLMVKAWQSGDKKVVSEQLLGDTRCTLLFLELNHWSKPLKMCLNLCVMPSK